MHSLSSVTKHAEGV